MATEIERKFLLRDNSWQDDAAATFVIRQAYISPNVRIRHLSRAHKSIGEPWLLTVKKDTDNPMKRLEVEFEVEPAIGKELMESFGEFVIEKTRYLVHKVDCVWEIDVFKGKHAGLVLAEVELASVEQQVNLPDWIGEEVTGKKEYTNSYLARNE